MDTVTFDKARCARPVSLLLEVKRRVKVCLLCRGKHIIAVWGFIPHEQYRPLFAAPQHPGKPREWYYALCEKCMRRNLRSNGKLVEQKNVEALAGERQGAAHPLQ